MSTKIMVALGGKWMQSSAKETGQTVGNLDQLMLLAGLGKPVTKKTPIRVADPQPRHQLGHLRVVDQIGELTLLDALNSGDPDHAELVQWVDECLATGRDARGAERPALRKIPSKGDAWKGWMSADKDIMLGLEEGRPVLIVDLLGRHLGTGIGEEESNSRLFLGFVLSKLFTLLAKCKVCGRYFILRQPNRTKPYLDGTFCADHQQERHKGQKARSTAQAREEAKVTLYELIASAFKKAINKDPEWFADPSLKERIVTHVNDAISKSDELRAIYRAGITAKWLAYAENRRGINAAVRASKGK